MSKTKKKKKKKKHWRPGPIWSDVVQEDLKVGKSRPEVAFENTPLAQPLKNEKEQ